MTVTEVLELTKKQLDAVRVPIELLDEIGIPGKGASNNIQAVLEAMAREPEKEEPAKEAEDHADADAE